MEIVTTNGYGGRYVYRAELMADHYDPPGIEFVPASDHDHDTAYPVATCRAAVGEALIEQSPTIEALADVETTGDEGDGDDAEGGSGDATPTRETEESPSGALTLAERIENAPYRVLQKVGGQIEGVDGGADGDSLRTALHDSDSDAVRAAFAGVDDSTDSDSDTDTEENTQ